MLGERVVYEAFFRYEEVTEQILETQGEADVQEGSERINTSVFLSKFIPLNTTYIRSKTVTGPP